MLTSVHVLSPNFTQISSSEMIFQRPCLPDKKVCFFSGPFWPTLTETTQSFQGSIPTEPLSLCKISSGSVQDCQSYFFKLILDHRNTKIHLYARAALSLLLHTISMGAIYLHPVYSVTCVHLVRQQ